MNKPLKFLWQVGIWFSVFVITFIAIGSEPTTRGLDNILVWLGITLFLSVIINSMWIYYFKYNYELVEKDESEYYTESGIR